MNLPPEVCDDRQEFHRPMCLTSARVGVGYSIMDSKSCEATMTGLLSLRHVFTISCCTDGTCSSGIWAPKSPRATMAPSETRIMSSRFFRESLLSILAKTPIDLFQGRYAISSTPLQCHPITKTSVYFALTSLQESEKNIDWSILPVGWSCSNIALQVLDNIRCLHKGNCNEIDSLGNSKVNVNPILMHTSEMHVRGLRYKPGVNI